jgi:hypothetical protein
MSRKSIEFLTKLVEEENFDTTVRLKDGTSLQDYAKSNKKNESLKILERN